MRKRKPPILAVTILLICGAVAVGFNFKSGINEKAVQQQQQASEIKVDKPRQETSKDQIAAKVKAESKQPSAPKQNPMARKMGGPGGPSIEMPKAFDSKPVPNDTSVSSQWYQSGSGRGNGG